MKPRELTVSDRKMILNFIRSKIYNEQDAEDIFQDTLLQAYLCQHNYSGAAKFTTWVCGIAFNLCRNFRQKKKIDPLNNASDLIPDDHFCDELDRLLAKESLKIVSNKVDNLCARDRIVFELGFIRQREYKEMADFLCLPIGTIRSKINRIRNKLKEVV